MSHAVLTIDTFMADRGHPHMTVEARAAAEVEWKRWEEHIARDGCPRYATVEIRPDNGGFEDYTHACDACVGAMLSHRSDTQAPRHYEVRVLSGDEVRSLWCCNSVTQDDPAKRIAALEREVAERSMLAASYRSMALSGEEPGAPEDDLARVRAILDNRKPAA